MDSTGLLTGANAAIVALVLMITGALKMLFDKFFSSELGQRVLPVIPIVLGLAFALIGVSEDGASLKEKIISGIVSGIAAALAFKVGKTSVMGQGLTPPKE